MMMMMGGEGRGVLGMVDVVVVVVVVEASSMSGRRGSVELVCRVGGGAT
jgi:hypothetical protein